MKKSIFFLAAAAMVLCFASCSEKINETDVNEPVSTIKSVYDLIGTDWTYTMNDTIVFDEMIDDSEGIILNFQFGLSFDTAYAHISFPDEFVLYSCVDNNGEMTIEELEELQYSYTYDPISLSGELIAYADDTETVVIPFTYDPTTDAISVNLNVAIDDEDNTYALVLVFHRNV